MKKYAYNPILPLDKYIPDGEPHVFDGRMYIFGSRDVTNGFLPNGERDFCSTDYHVIYSDDLIHWTDAGVSISIDSIPAEIRGNTRRLWAPDVFKSPTEKDKYYSYNGKVYLCNLAMAPCVWAPDTAGLWQWTEVQE